HEAEIAQLKIDIEVSDLPEALARLREYLSRTARPEDRTWAEQEIAKLQAGPADRATGVSPQLRKFFPIRSGRFLVYRRADGEIRERIRTDSVTREGGVLRVYYTLEEIYREYSTRKAYYLELEKDAVMLTAGSEREPLL